MPSWLLVSIIASVALTVVANLVPRLFPDVTRSAERRFLDRMERQLPRERRRTRVIVPWKTMLVVSVLGTIALNVIL